MNNQTTETLNKIKAKQKLGLPLTRYENAMIILYGGNGNPRKRGRTHRGNGKTTQGAFRRKTP